MIVKVTLKDAKKREHVVEMHAADDEERDDLAYVSDALGHILKWVEHGTTEIKEPLDLVSVERL